MIHLHPGTFKKLKAMDVKVSVYISDYHSYPRSWAERLFTWPFNPFRSHKSVYCPTVILNEGIAYVSPETKRIIDKIP